jgi:hypothetical protein
MIDDRKRFHAVRDASLARFAALRCDAEKLLRQAAGLPQLPDHYRAQALAAANLAGLRLHRGFGAPTAEDARAIRDDLEDVAVRVVDPLVAAMGAEADDLIGGIDRSLFDDQLFSAIDGNALHALDCAADRLDEERREQEADPRGWAKAQSLGVD